MSRLSFFAAGAVLTASLATTPVAFARKHHHAHIVMLYSGIVRGSQSFTVPGWAYAAPRPTLRRYDDTPSYDDPSRFGGGEALPVK